METNISILNHYFCCPWQWAGLHSQAHESNNFIDRSCKGNPAHHVRTDNLADNMLKYAKYCYTKYSKETKRWMPNLKLHLK